jgi:GTP-binding protein Era
MSDAHKSGYAAIVGRPNAGKSTLLNSLLGVKLAIATHKAQTTRHRILGIYSDDDRQILFLDTPGIIDPRYKLQEAMMKAVTSATRDADVVLHLVDVRYPDDVEIVQKQLGGVGKPVILGLNKCDLADADTIAKAKTTLTAAFKYAEVLELSAKMNSGLDTLLDAITRRLLPFPPLYPKDQLSENPEKFFVAELIREQVFLQYSEEIPYSVAVDIVSYEEAPEIDHIHADIVVSRDSQKGILIGKGGIALKRLGTAARKSIEEFTGRRANLQLFVKVREKWRDKDAFLRGFGYS